MNDLHLITEDILRATEQAGISPAEVTVSISESFTARVRAQKLEDYQVSDRYHLTLRGLWQGRIGTSSTQDISLDALPMLLQGVKESAELIEETEQDLILPPDSHYETVPCFSPDVEQMDASSKIALAMQIDRLVAKSDSRITPDSTVVSSASSTYMMRNTCGLNLMHRDNMVYAYASCLAKQDASTATGFKLLWGHHPDAVCAETLAKGCVADALQKLGAERMASGPQPVILRNTAMADLLSTFCGIFSADHAQKGMSLLNHREGECIASSVVTLIDDPLMPWGLASCPFDREGAATHTKRIIENGTLLTLLHNRRTAKHANTQTTGNASGGGHVSPSNLYILPSSEPLESLQARMNNGLLITEISGLHAGANPISGDFSLLARGFEITGGQIVRAVEQFTVAGNFYRLLEDIVAVGQDLVFEGSPIGSPSVWVKSLNIAGQ